MSEQGNLRDCTDSSSALKTLWHAYPFHTELCSEQPVVVAPPAPRPAATLHLTVLVCDSVIKQNGEFPIESPTRTRLG